MTDTAKVWFHRARAATWAVIGALSFTFGFANSVTLVWIASLYANVVSDWTAGEAADNREVIDLITKLENTIHNEPRQCQCARPTPRNRPKWRATDHR